MPMSTNGQPHIHVKGLPNNLAIQNVNVPFPCVRFQHAFRGIRTFNKNQKIETLIIGRQNPSCPRTNILPHIMTPIAADCPKMPHVSKFTLFLINSRDQETGQTATQSFVAEAGMLNSANDNIFENVDVKKSATGAEHQTNPVSF